MTSDDVDCHGKTMNCCELDKDVSKFVFKFILIQLLKSIF